ncbi:hypothetical protein BD779DRAFT_1472039 [Infundibulicybe gibba]|nr:hypothetical protein BD779DRAFT_1475106 [Infundibulicybe gibba]KAF8884480.1 hypothetical protein BD779DRAFT_1472039 [Infundibulicybe gibba]
MSYSLTAVSYHSACTECIGAGGLTRGASCTMIAENWHEGPGKVSTYQFAVEIATIVIQLASRGSDDGTGWGVGWRAALVGRRVRRTLRHGVGTCKGQGGGAERRHQMGVRKDFRKSILTPTENRTHARTQHFRFSIDDITTRIRHLPAVKMVCPSGSSPGLSRCHRCATATTTISESAHNAHTANRRGMIGRFHNDYKQRLTNDVQTTDDPQIANGGQNRKLSQMVAHRRHMDDDGSQITDACPLLAASPSQTHLPRPLLRES